MSDELRGSLPMHVVNDLSVDDRKLLLSRHFNTLGKILKSYRHIEVQFQKVSEELAETKKKLTGKKG